MSMLRSAKYLLVVSSMFIAVSLQSQTATLTPSSLSFGTQVINTTSSPMAATLKNTSSSQTITISSIATTGDCPDKQLPGISSHLGGGCQLHH